LNVFARVIAVLTLAVPSLSASMIYSTRAEWLAAVDSPYTAAFEGQVANTSVPYNTSFGYQAPPITVVGYGEGGTFYLRNSYYTAAASPYNWGTGAVLESANNNGNTRLHIVSAGSRTAFGINLMTIGYGNPVGISINGGPEISVATSSNRATPTFWGITYDTAIDTVDIRPLTLATALLIDNASTGMAKAAITDPPADPGAEIPEAASILLAGTGLVMLGIWRRVKS
jgi:hypothetical protein